MYTLHTRWIAISSLTLSLCAGCVLEKDDDDITVGDDDDDITVGDDDDTTAADDDDSTAADDDDSGAPVDADGDGWDESVDCDDGDAALNLDDADGDGVDTCSGDCDDGDPDAFPGAPEFCDGVDQNCNGVLDDQELWGEYSLGCADLVIYGEEASDYVGSVHALGDLDGDGWDDFGIGSYDNGCRGSAYVVFGPVEPGEHELSANDPHPQPLVYTRITGANAGDLTGNKMAVGDLNDDGFPDLVVSAHLSDVHADDAGALYVFFGPLPVGEELDVSTLDPATTAEIHGQATAEHLGASVAVGELNGDGVDDLAFGAPFCNEGGIGGGAVYVLFGPIPPGSYTADDADSVLLPEALGDLAGAQLTIGNIGGAGWSRDLIVASPYHDLSKGRVYVLFDGAPPGTYSLATADVTFTGASPGDAVGRVLIAHVDGDGSPDLVLGAPDAGGGTGSTYVVYGPLGADTHDLGALAISHSTLHTSDPGGLLGYSISSVGNVDGAGLDDLLIGAPWSDGVGADSGAAYLLLNPLTAGTYDLADTSNSDSVLAGSAADDHAGVSVSGAGDVNGDGYDDLIIGASENDMGGAEAGAVYVVFGRP